MTYKGGESSLALISDTNTSIIPTINGVVRHLDKKANVSHYNIC